MRTTFLLLLLAASAGPAAARPVAPDTLLFVRPSAAAPALHLQVYRGDGTLRFSAEVPHHPDDPLPQAALSAGTGDVVYALPGTAEVVFLAPDGALRRRATLFEAASYDLERNVLVAWRPDGRAVAVAAQRVPDGPGADTDARLFLFDRDGTLRWQRPLPGPALAALSVAPDGRVAVETYDAYTSAAVTYRRHVFTPNGTPAEAGAFDFDAGGVRLVPARATAHALPGGRDVQAAPDARDRAGFAAAPAEAQYAWPVTPLHESHEITGTFAEYRDTAPAPHFHDGVDVPKPDGSPVYAVVDARVTGVGADWIRTDEYAFVHVAPAPGLAPGDSVFAGQTVVGTILNGYGHVHFVDGPNLQERQPLRAGGGLTPYVDPWAPAIEDVRFYSQPTRQRLGTNELTGPVEITFRVAERSAPPGAPENRLNNGAHVVGYKVLTRDRQTAVYVPGDDGVRFRFDVTPGDSRVHYVFDRLQSSTDRHVYIVTNRVDGPDAWDTTALPEGDYTVMLFARDTRDNEAVAYVDVTVRQRDIVPPPVPTLLSAVPVPAADGPRAAFTWTGGDADDLAGYHLYRADAPYGARARWPGDAPIEALPDADGTRAFAWDAAGVAPAYFYVTAADTVAAPNESAQSDVYGLAPDPHGRRLLVVDGFDRSTGSGSWQAAWHPFAGIHGRALAAAGFGFATAANEAVTAGRVDLNDYDAVFWVLGDESTVDETFSTAEQARVRAYLEAGGNLFVSGSEIAWDLDQRGDDDDRAFAHDYLKVRYAGDDAESYAVTGTGDGVFAGANLRYGAAPYEEDYPDYFFPSGGGVETLRYGNGRTAGVQYAGPFGAGTAEGRVVVLGFPFETVSGQQTQEAVMARVLGFFFPESTHAGAGTTLPPGPALAPAYPNPFRTATTFAFTLAQPGPVTLAVYDVLGRRVARVADADYAAGTHTVHWAPSEGAGLYFVRLEAGGTVHTQAVTRLR